MIGWILGIDPGLGGALALWHPDGVQIEDMPTVSGTSKRQVDESALANILRCFDIEHAFYERVHSMPKQGVVSSFSFGVSFGVIRGALAALSIPRTQVEPTTWKRAMGLVAGAPKDASRHRAAELCPKSGHYLLRRKDDGRAEALLIALYGARQLRRG